MKKKILIIGTSLSLAFTLLASSFIGSSSASASSFIKETSIMSRSTGEEVGTDCWAAIGRFATNVLAGIVGSAVYDAAKSSLSGKSSSSKSSSSSGVRTGYASAGGFVSGNKAKNIPEFGR